MQRQHSVSETLVELEGQVVGDHGREYANALPRATKRMKERTRERQPRAVQMSDVTAARIPPTGSKASFRELSRAVGAKDTLRGRVWSQVYVKYIFRVGPSRIYLSAVCCCRHRRRCRYYINSPRAYHNSPNKDDHRISSVHSGVEENLR